MQSCLSESQLEAELSKHLSKTPMCLCGVWRRSFSSYIYKRPVLLHVTMESPLKLSVPRKIMGRDSIKLKQQLKNHTKKHYTHIHTNLAKHFTIISFIPFDSHVR